MKNKKLFLTLCGSLILVLILIKIIPLIILNITYSSKFGPEIFLRREVVNILEKKFDVPEDYTFYFKAITSRGEIPTRIYFMYLNWTDEEGFNYIIEVEFNEILSDIHKITPTITKNSDYNLSFKDYTPSMYFNNGGFDFNDNNYVREESTAIKHIRKDVNHVLKSGNVLELTFLALPAVAIYDVAGTKALAVAVISKEDSGYIYEYDYDGDGKIDEIKRFNIFQDQTAILEDLANRLGIKDLSESYSYGYSNDLTTFAKFSDKDGLIIELTIDPEDETTKIWLGYEEHQFYER